MAQNNCTASPFHVVSDLFRIFSDSDTVLIFSAQRFVFVRSAQYICRLNKVNDEGRAAVEALLGE